MMAGLSMGGGLALRGLWRATREQLDRLTQPVLVFRSAQDHVVGPGSLAVLRQALAPGQLTVRDCPDSFHVATLDNDAEAIFTGSLDFISRHSEVQAGELRRGGPRPSGAGEGDAPWRRGNGQRA
jgi:pimeloyl-ACP methyl ester carboxylesterase